MKRSPERLVVPSSGTWHVVVDFLGLRGGNARVNVRVLPHALPPIRSRDPLPLPPLVRHGPSNNVEGIVAEDDALEYDAFISHASEDKDEIARPLAQALIAEGLKVWYDELTLKIGDSLRRKIDAGLARSSFGVIILSQHFFAKNWPQHELDGLVARAMSDELRILPVWHRITKAEVMAQSPSLADKLGRNTSEYTPEEIAREIAQVVLGR